MRILSPDFTPKQKLAVKEGTSYSMSRFPIFSRHPEPLNIVGVDGVLLEWRNDDLCIIGVLVS
jgi:hypothetical protein